jgi:lysozyme
VKLSSLFAFSLIGFGLYLYTRPAQASLTVSPGSIPYSPPLPFWPEIQAPVPAPTVFPTNSEVQTMGAKNFSPAAVTMIKGFEGFSDTPYPDADGWSIGFGHYMGPFPTMQNITMKQAEILLSQDMGEAENAVSNYVKVPLTQNQFDALTSFVYNVGTGNFASSTLLRKLNAGDYAGAAEEFKRWNKSQGKISNALVARRAKEQAVFEA